MFKENIFPIWNPTLRVKRILEDSMNEKFRFKVYRDSCSAFIAKLTVRSIIFDQCNSKCAQCESSDNLAIDHIKSVLYFFKTRQLELCNIESNLQLLCRKCNSSKLP